ncbi:hypothetical protein EV183_004477 [Coemansia sp. RSA 2336]|nr:hypothetical protein EV183_004477 [Coemansia sp. RSA 2336]
MADFESSGSGNVYRPYADLNPLEGIRNISTSSESALHVAGLPTMGLEDMEFEDVDTTQAVADFARFAGSKLLMTLISNPFSVAHTLVQVQHLPMSVRAEVASKAAEEEQAEEEAPDPDDPAYYEYLRARHSGRAARVSRATADHNGYVRAAKPGYELPALPSGRMAVVRRIIQQPTEGVLSLFKGSMTQWIYDVLHVLLQPSLEALLGEMLGAYDTASAAGAVALVASNIVVGWLLSPLELVRTRLVVQSASPLHRKYNGPLHALRLISREEGGLRSIYFSPYHLIPTLMRHSLYAGFRDLGSTCIEFAGIDPYDRPAAFASAGLVWKTLALLVMLPIDTARARLQAQPRYARRSSQGKGDFREFRPCVAVSSVPYTGMANCMWRIIAEEGASLKQLRKSADAPTSNVGHYGLRGLYPGLSLQLMLNAVAFGLGFIGDDDAVM